MEAILEKSGKSDEDKMVPEIPSVTMEQIGGLENAKKELIEQIMVNIDDIFYFFCCCCFQFII